jgi:hypothetical protein
LGVLAFTLIDQAAQQIMRQEQATPVLLRDLETLQSSLRQTIALLGVIVSLLIIGTGAYMNAVRAFRRVSSEAASQVPEPSQSVLIVYGSVFVLALLAMYMPASRSVHSAGLRAVQLIEDMPGGSRLPDPASSTPTIGQEEANRQPHTSKAALDQPWTTVLPTQLKRRAELRSALGVDTTIEQNLRGAIVVLSPLITSAVAVFLGA